MGGAGEDNLSALTNCLWSAWKKEHELGVCVCWEKRDDYNQDNWLTSQTDVLYDNLVAEAMIESNPEQYKDIECASVCVCVNDQQTWQFHMTELTWRYAIPTAFAFLLAFQQK